MNNEFAFLNTEPSITNILYGLSGICGQLGLLFLMFSSEKSLKLITFVSSFYIYCHI